MAREGNSNSKSKVKNPKPGPWASWKGSRAAKTIRFIEEQCIVPKGTGRGETFKLLPFQEEWLEEVLAEGVKSAALSCPRGQGKTGCLSALALATVHLDEYSPEIPLAAVTVGQLTRPSGLFGVIRRMSELNPELDDRSIYYQSPSNTSLKVPVNNGLILPISTRNEGQMQGLDIRLAVIDELAHLDMPDWQALTGSAIKSEDALVVGISTPGRPDSALHQLRKMVMSGKEMPGFVWREFAAPDGYAIDDVEGWKIANPALGTLISEDALRSALATTSHWLFEQYHLGRWVDVSEDSWLGPTGGDLWDSLNDPYEPQDGDACWMGVDVSLKFDSTAVVSVFERPDGRFHATCKIFFPSSGVVDQALVREHIREQADKYRVGAVAYDPRFFVASAQDLDSEGIDMVEIPQSPARLVPIVGGAYTTIIEGKMTHAYDEAFRQQVLNAIPRPSEAGWTLYKRKGLNTYRIDAAIALCFALSVVDIEPGPTGVINLY